MSSNGKRRRGRSPKPKAPESFTQLIRDLRGRSALTQTEYAQQLGVEARTVSRWENGDEPPALAFVYMLALAGLDVSQVLDESLGIPGALADAPGPPAFTLERLARGLEALSDQIAGLAEDLRIHDREMVRRLAEIQASLEDDLEDDEE